MDNPYRGSVCIVPNFHYDVAYLRPYAEYLPACFQILDEAIGILQRHPQYRFLVEQVILLQEYWSRFPEKHDLLRQFAAQGRLAVAPGMYVMPDMNHPDGESMFLQARIGKQWLKEKLGIEADVCWIADCWGHHAQLPQILRQCGYEYYVFWRCMRRDVMRNDFLWQGLDGTRLKAHWLARSYSNLQFPAALTAQNLLDQDLQHGGVGAVKGLLQALDAYGDCEVRLLCNGGDMAHPQESAVAAVEAMNRCGELPPVRLATPGECLKEIGWETKPVVTGEFNSALHGSFTSSIRIKQLNRELVNRLLSAEALAAVTGETLDSASLWPMLLKQQFHDIICGTIADAAVHDCFREFEQARHAIETALASLAAPSGQPAAFNPLSFPRTELVEREGRPALLDIPALGFAPTATARPLAASPAPALPGSFENRFYRAAIAANGFITSLTEKTTGRELVRPEPCPFGAPVMQVDNGDLWLNFQSPLQGGSLDSSLTDESRDPFDRYEPGRIVSSGTIRPTVDSADVVACSEGHMTIRQRGTLSFWRLRIALTTLITFYAHSPRIDYQMRMLPSGKHYRLRVAFPSTLANGVIRHEIPFGIQVRQQGEHIAQNWMSYSDSGVSLAVMNSGTPGNNVDDGILLLTLFRSAAMEYKAPSDTGFAEGVEHVFRYALMPCPAGREIDVIRQGQAFNRPPVLTRASATGPGGQEAGWGCDCENVLVSGLRPHTDGVFVRIYEATGAPANGILRIPRRFARFAPADGLERATAALAPCRGAIPFALKPFQIASFMLKTS